MTAGSEMTGISAGHRRGGPVWELRQTALAHNPERYPWIGDLCEPLFSVKAGDLDRLAARRPVLKPYRERRIATVEGEPTLKL